MGIVTCAGEIENKKWYIYYFWRYSVHTSYMTLLASTREWWVSEIISYCDWEYLSMPKENYLLSRCCHVSSIVGKCALFCAFLNDDSSPKHSWFAFDSQEWFSWFSFRLASAWVSPIELLHIECVLLYSVSQKSVSTKWRIYKGKIWTPNTSPSMHAFYIY